MGDFKTAVAFVLKNEGDYSQDPEDAGGETKFGISQRSYPNLDIKNLTRDQAIAIYREDFWAPYQDFDEPIATKLFDLAVHMGHKQAVQILQRALRSCGAPHLKDDGILGPLTRQAITIARSELLIVALRSEAAGFYRTLAVQNPRNQKFLAGWLTRGYL